MTETIVVFDTESTGIDPHNDRALPEGFRWITDYRDYTGLYAVNKNGDVYSAKTGKLLNNAPSKGYRTVSLYSNRRGRTHKVHRLIAVAFLENPNNLPFVRHLNDIRDDNRLENLAWGDCKSNYYDARRNGRVMNLYRTECLYGHAYDEKNLALRGVKQHKTCRKCQAIGAKEKRDKGLPKDSDKHGSANGYLNSKCRCNLCKTAYSEYIKNRKLRLKNNPNLA